MPETNWIPCDASLPGHRLPTEADEGDFGTVHVQDMDGYFDEVPPSLLSVCDKYVAWAPIPKSRPTYPYVPPKVERERKECWVVFCPDGSMYRGVWSSEEYARGAATRTGGHCCRMVEVRDGDPTPEAIAEVVESMRSAANAMCFDARDVRNWAKKLGG